MKHRGLTPRSCAARRRGSAALAGLAGAGLAAAAAMHVSASASASASAAADEPPAWATLEGGPLDACPISIIAGDSATVTDRWATSPGPTAVADLDGDGRSEVLAVTTHVGVHRLGIVRASDGRLGIPRLVEVPNRGWSLLAEDLDGDGDPDLLVHGSGLGGAVFLTAVLNDGTGELSVAWSESVPIDGRQVAIRTRPDGGRSVLLPSREGGTIERELDGLEGLGPVIAVLPEPAIRAVVLDADGDGREDVITAGTSSEGMRLYRARDGDGFEPARVIPTEFEKARLVAGDVNGDGRGDLVILRQPAPGGERFRVHLGQADGTMGPALSTFGPPILPPRVPVLADVDRDGILDVVIPSAYDVQSGRIDTFFGAGDGSFAFGGAVPTYAWLGLAVADLDGDEDLEFVSIGGTFVVARGLAEASGGMPDAADGIPGTTRLLAAIPGPFVALDVDGDGAAEIVRGSGDRLELVDWSGVGPGTVVGQVVRPGEIDAVLAAPSRSAGDHLPSVIVVHARTFTTKRAVVARLGGRGPVIETGGLGLDLAGGRRIEAAADLDADGDPDVILSGDVDGSSIEIRPRLVGRFGEPVVIHAPAGFTLLAARAGFIDADDAADVAVVWRSLADPDRAILEIGRGAVGGPVPDALTRVASFNVSTSASGPAPAVSLVDWESDGDVDVLVAGASNSSLLRQAASGGFAAEVVLHDVADAAPVRLQVAGDLDGDGIVDVAGYDTLSRLTTIGLGHDGPTGPRLEFRGVPNEVDSVTRGMHMADLDGDGRPSLLWTTCTGIGKSEPTSCPDRSRRGDLDADGRVDFQDLLLLLGPIPSSVGFPALTWDLDGDGLRSGADIRVMLDAWTG